MENGESKTNGGVPPKVDPSKTVGMTPPPLSTAQKKQTTRIELAMETPEAGKRKTSRIPLATAIENTAATSEAIQIESPLASAGGPGAKTETSRIPLDIALQGMETHVPGAPKTIRIKRPSQASTIRLSRTGGASEASAAAADIAEKSKTSRIDISAIAAEPEAGVPTQRKTIKIRRPEGGIKLRALTVARSEEAAASAESASPEEAPIGGPFLVPLVISLVIVCVLIYMMAVQAFPTLKLAFPGRLV